MQKKGSILALYKILNKHADERHPIKRKDLEHIMKSEYDIKIDRKTLHDHIELLNEFDCEIHSPTSPNDGYFLGERTFESSEIHLLCNAIYAAHFIPEKATEDLIKKLLNTQSKYAKKEFLQTVYMKNIRKTVNKEFFLNVELLNEAIQSNKAVSFDYMKYDLSKKLIRRKDHTYIIHPYYIIYANENYYLICNHEGYRDLSHYRIDKMQNIHILEAMNRKPLHNSFDPYAYANSKIYMYGGEEERITLKCQYVILDDIIERFGKDVYLQSYDEQHFLAIIQASHQGVLYLCLQYLKYCEVTAPLSLRYEIKDVLKSASISYQ